MINDMPVSELFASHEIISESPAPTACVWVVVAYHRFNNRWSVRPSFWFDKAEATKEAQHLSPCWGHRKIVKIELP